MSAASISAGHVVVTGGTSGIGAGIARHLAMRGYSVTATGVSAAEIAAFEPQTGIDALLLDVTDDAAVADPSLLRR